MLMLSFGISMESGGVYSQTSFKEQSVMWEGDVSSVTQTTANRSHCLPGFCAIGSFEACHSHNNTCPGSLWELTQWWHNSSVCSSTFHGCCVGATSVLLQTPTKWHLLLLSVGQGKPAGSLQGRGRQCAHLPPPKPAGLFGVRARPKSLLPPHCSRRRSGFAGPVPPAVYQIGPLVAFPWHMFSWEEVVE